MEVSLEITLKDDPRALESIRFLLAVIPLSRTISEVLAASWYVIMTSLASTIKNKPKF
jgi:hypothetical protein